MKFALSDNLVLRPPTASNNRFGASCFALESAVREKLIYSNQFCCRPVRPAAVPMVILFWLMLSLVQSAWAQSPPTITAQPRTQTLTAGGNLILGAGVTGDALRYQWRFNNAPIAGQTNLLLFLPMTTTNNSGNYTLVVSNFVNSVTSAVATVTVKALPAARAVVAWGDFGYGESTVPAGSSNAVAVVAGVYESLALTDDGSVLAWGTYNQSTVPVGLSNVVALAMSYLNFLALRNDGTVVAWGDNSYGQTNVPPGLSNVVAIASVDTHNLALRNDGTVVAWGDNSYGQSAVPAGLSNVVAVTAGSYHNVALRNDGTVVAWGLNSDGQTSVPAGLSNVVAVAAGFLHNLAVRNDGTVVAWGLNLYDGQATVPAGLSNVVAVSAGRVNSMALRNDGTVIAWGGNSYGQSTIPDGLSGVIAIAAGYIHSLALMSGPPAIVTQPQFQIISAGGTATFPIAVGGPEPLSYQWRFNSVNIFGATNATFILTNAPAASAGLYTVVISNALGAITSAPGTLTFNTGLPGSIDPAFNPVQVESPVRALLVQSDGKLLVAGSWGDVGGVGRTNLARLNSDGTLDTSYVPAAVGNGSYLFYINAIAMQSDGKLLVAGEFTNVNAVARNRIARLNADGSLDAGFNPGTGADGPVRAVVLQADGKILIGGDFTNFNGVARGHIARLNSSGSLDGSFLNTGSGLGGNPLAGPYWVNGITIQPDGKILAGGYFADANGALRNNIARLNADGTTDTTFNPGVGATSPVFNTAVQSDGKVLAVGNFSYFNNIPRSNIVRLNPDGSVDTGFDPGTGADDAVYNLFIQPDGRILIGGHFTRYNGVRRNGASRLNYNGSLDTSFDTGSGTYDWINAWDLAPDGQIYMGGNFSVINGFARYHVARLNPGPSMYPTINPSVQGSGTVSYSPSITNYSYGQSVTLTATAGRYYTFLRWSDGNTNNPRAITVGMNNFFTAVFTNTVPLETLVFKQWERDFGGTGDDYAEIIQQTRDGGYIIGGVSSSPPSGNKTSPNYGGSDFWVIKLDGFGIQQWDRTFGGIGEEILKSLQETADGGFILGGYSSSGVSGNKTSPNYGSYDFWMVRLDVNGNKLWDQSFGGSDDDFLFGLQQAADGGFILSGQSSSAPGGNKTGPLFGISDAWVVRLDVNGNKLWDRSYGGTYQDRFGANPQPTLDGGFILGGLSFSSSTGNKTSANYGQYDAWAVRIDSSGNLQWENSFGGSGGDAILERGLQQTGDGGFVFGGYSDSPNSGNKTSANYGDRDFWLVRLDPGGNKLWDQSYGGAGIDEMISVARDKDGGFVLAGRSSSSPGGNKTSPNFGGFDMWVVKIDANGNKLWEQSYGGTNHEQMGSIQQTTDGGLILGGYSYSGVNGNKTTPNYGSSDFWMVKAFAREAPIGTPVVLVNGSYYHQTITTNPVSVTITSSIPNAHIYYTTNGTEPDFGSSFYTGPFLVRGSLGLRSVASDAAESFLTETITNFIVFVPSYTLTDTTPGGGTVTFDPPGGTYLSNSVVMLSASAAPGWTFAGWAGDAAGASNITTVTVSGNKSAKAIFTTGLYGSPSPAGTGAILASPAGGVYAYGQPVLLSAIPAAGKYFLKWSVANYGSNSPLSITITNANVTNNAQFSTLTGNNRTLTLRVNGSGFASKSPLAGFYSDGATVTITATPDAGYVFTGWSGDATGVQNPLDVLMTTNKTIAANFGLNAPPQNIPPFVTITNPVDGAVFIAPANVTINGTADDIDGTVAQVVLFAGTNQLTTLFGSPFAFTWTNAPVGTNIVTAVATDNGGLSTTSAPVSVIMNLPAPGPPVFTLGTNAYYVVENGGSVTVTILKSFNSLAGTVNYATANGSAVAFENGVGDYQAVSGSLTFTNGEPSKMVSIPIVNDLSYEGNQAFSFLLSVSGGGGSLGSPSSAIITIIDDDPPATTNSFLGNSFPGAVPPHDGQLRVTLEPAAAGGQWRLAWETAWRNSGDTIGGLPSGNYAVEFKPVDGYLAPGISTNPVVAGVLTSVTNTYAGSGAAQFGTLTVTLQPAAVANALNQSSRGQWRLQGEANWHDSGFTTNLIAGNQIVEFKTIADWITPSPRVVIVGADQENGIGSTYLVAQVSGATPPSVLQFSDASSAAFGLPYVYNGQLLSESGYGSGFVVKRRVVLTAAHVVFNDATLTFVSSVNWFFQRYASQYEPPAQVPRGWYAFSGYAAARTNDNSPGVSSPASQNQDVAALYFLEDAGRGGQGGYLVSDPGGTEWLQATALKTLVGYPVESVSDINRGKLHATTPGNIGFAVVSNRVFSTADVRGYPGMSGGPLCVQYTNGTYYPAAIYLGGSGQTIVRAIDGAVADLINRADVTANTGDNNTGGGVVQLIPGGGGSLFAPGYFRMTLGPPEALAAGAGWRILQSTNLSYFSDNTATYALPAAGYTIVFHPAFGFLTPSNRTLQVAANQTVVLTVNYLSLAPRATAPVFSSGALNLAFTAPVGQRYAIEWSTNLVNWLPLVTNQVPSDGILRFTDPGPTHPPRGFYRARLVP